jgi:eukaryotic-like serine/threonine-protein kinase
MPQLTSLGMAAQIGLLELLDKAKSRELADRIRPQFECGEQLIRELASRGWLTPFQVKKLLEGKGNELVFGPYVLLDHLAQGGMGQVYRARHKALARTVALKVIRRDVLSNNVAVARFEREAQAAAQLRHPNVVRSYDAGQAEGTYYLAMEFLEGLDFLTLVQRQGPLSVPQACDFIRQAACGLQHAHELGFVHRDIKPANLIITRQNSGVMQRPGSGQLSRPGVGQSPWGVVKILDFGLARLQSPDSNGGSGALTQVGSLMGTPDFLAPEQAFDSHAIDIRADLYSLGCTFYFLLSGRVPFPGGALTEKLIRQRKEEPTAVDMARREQLRQYGHFNNLDTAGEVPGPIADIVRKLMAKAPADRFQTPAELVEALESLPRVGGRSAHVAKAADTSVKLPRPTGVLRLGATQRVRSSHSVETIVLAPQQKTELMQPKRRVRKWLVAVGFLVCCGLGSRLWTAGLTLNADQYPSASKPIKVPPQVPAPQAGNGAVPAKDR